MKIIDLPLPGVKLIQPKAFYDERGFFLETYRQAFYRELGIDCEFVQDNHSCSKKGTIRGMHFQKSPGQAKLISVVVGEIFDVAVDIRPDSPNFLKWTGVVLRAEAHEQIFIPVGFAHGFCVLSETAHLCYKISSMYDPDEEKGFRYNDPDIGIEWPQVAPPLLSARDLNAPYFRELGI